MNNMQTTIHHITEWLALVIELLAIAVIVAGVVMVVISRGTVRYLFHLPEPGTVERYKEQLGRPLSLGLLLTVASDVIRNVTAEATAANFAVLGLLVVVRTALSWSLFVELEGRWPWQRPHREPSRIEGSSA
jgi:uncharacterized membrane protein